MTSTAARADDLALIVSLDRPLESLVVRADEHAEPDHKQPDVPSPYAAMDYRVSVIIPALNEEENIPHVLPRVPSWVHEVILVDGNSTDNTVSVAQECYPSIRIIQQEGRGKGAAIRTGLNAATGDMVVLLDADGSTDPSEIPAFVGALLAGADFAKGSRFTVGGGSADMTLLHSLGNVAFVTLANLLFRTRFTDITYGYNALWRRHMHALALEIDGWSNEIVSNIRIARQGFRLVEVSSFEQRRIGGSAKLRTFSAGWTILQAIVKERLTIQNRRIAGARTPLAAEGNGTTD